MKIDEVQRVIDLYRRKFEELGVGKIDYPHEEFLYSPKQGLEHCHGMLDKMEEFIREGRTEKLFRWLGFLQGFLWSQKIYTLTELKKQNSTDPE